MEIQRWRLTTQQFLEWQARLRANGALAPRTEPSDYARAKLEEVCLPKMHSVEGMGYYPEGEGRH